MKRYTAAELRKVNARLEGQTPQEIVRWATETFPKRLVTSSSFQTQSVPLLFMVSQIAPDMPILFLDTGYHFPETLAFRQRLAKEWDLNVRDLHGDKEQERRSTSGQPLHATNPDLCCFLNKVAPLREATRHYDAWISGIRRDQSRFRHHVEVVEQPDVGPLRIHPFAAWTEADVEAFIREHRLPPHPLRSEGYPSVGCAPCTERVDDLERRSGRWQGESKIECGLHTVLRRNGTRPLEVNPHPIEGNGPNQKLLEDVSMKSVQIGDRLVGPGAPTYIAVETGTTCNGDVDVAKDMVNAAKNAGADAVKFQMIRPDEFMSDKNVRYEYAWAGGKRSENMYEMFRGLEFTTEEWREISAHCKSRGISFYATIDNFACLPLASELDLPAVKIGSWDIKNTPLVRALARIGKPVQVDLGPAHLADVAQLVETIRSEGNDQILLVHCSHAQSEDGLNLRSIPYLQDTFNLPAGYSADSRELLPDISAVALGANLLEKRLTLDKDFPGHHHLLALEPDEFTEYVQVIRRTERSLGDNALVPSEEDLRQRELYFTSLAAIEDIPAGTNITADMLACKRPGTGIPYEMIDAVVGRRPRRDIKQNELITWNDI